MHYVHDIFLIIDNDLYFNIINLFLFILMAFLLQ
jgi:hypothetical protein